VTIEEWLKREFPELSGIAPLAQGGQKVVFAARHPTEGNVVVKVILPGQDLSRIQREVAAVQQVKSRRVPRVLGAGTVTLPTGASLWLREERIEGESVREILTRGALVVTEVTRLGLNVLEALADAERARIVHRDVKPENIMRDQNGEFWLLDFGIARHLDLVSLTASAAIGGPATIGYAPPEQFRNRKREIDSRADLFALAVTMVECLIGRHPFRDGARDAADVLRRIENTAMVVPPIPGDGDGRLRELVVAMGQRRVDPRPRSAAEALAWMNEVCAPAGP